MDEPQGFVRPTNWNIYTPAEKAQEYARQGYVQDANGTWVKMGDSARRNAADRQETADKQAASIKQQDRTLKAQNNLNYLLQVQKNIKNASAATQAPLGSDRNVSMATDDPAVRPIVEAEKARNALKMKDARDSSYNPAIIEAEKKVQEANKNAVNDLVKNPSKASVQTATEPPKDQPQGTSNKNTGTSDSKKSSSTSDEKPKKSENTDNEQENFGRSSGSGIPLSESFYRGITSSLRNKPQGNLSDAKAATANAQAQNAQNTAANRQMEAQQAAQIGNRNEYAEAGKVASMQNDAKNVQNIQNREGLSGSSAAAMRETTTPDVGSERARQDQQRALASSLREKGDVWQQEATANRGLAQEYGLKSRDYDADIDKAAQIARGEGYDQPENQSDITGNFTGKAGKAWNKFTDKVHDYFDEGQEGIPAPEDMPEGAVVRSGDIPSDSHVKNIHECLSDLRMKYIKEDWDKTNQIGPDDLDFLLSKLGKFKHGDREYDLNNADDWKDDTDQSVLKAYADHIKNYLYTYKPEATQVDSSIDPNEEHIGPMAQDIEQVNPACVKETPEGVKTVDTARLAMMNAGAIGDLARQLQELTDRLKALGV